VAELFGTPSDYIKPEKDVTEARSQRSKTMPGAQTASTIANAAAIAKTLTEAHTDRPNVLTDIWKMLGGNLGNISNLLGGQAGLQPDPLDLSEETVQPQTSQPEQGVSNTE
jgi:hypothetical protein